MRYVELSKTVATEIAKTVFPDNHILPVREYGGKYYVQDSAMGYYAYASIQQHLIGKTIFDLPMEEQDETT